MSRGIEVIIPAPASIRFVILSYGKDERPSFCRKISQASANGATVTVSVKSAISVSTATVFKDAVQTERNCKAKGDKRQRACRNKFDGYAKDSQNQC